MFGKIGRSAGGAGVKRLKEQKVIIRRRGRPGGNRRVLHSDGETSMCYLDGEKGKIFSI